MLSIPFSNRKELKPQLQNPVVASAFWPTAKEPPRTRRSLAPATDQTRAAGSRLTASRSGSFLRNPSASHLGLLAVHPARAGGPRACRRRRGPGARPRAPPNDGNYCTPSSCGCRAASRAGLRRFETRSSEVGILARSKSRPAPISPQRRRSDRLTDAHRDAFSAPDSANSAGGAARLASCHSPSSLSRDRKPAPLLRVLNFKLPRIGSPQRTGHLGSAGTSERTRQARRAPRLSSRPERRDNSWTCSANEADRRAEQTELRRKAGPGGGRGGASPGTALRGRGAPQSVTGGTFSQSLCLRGPGRPRAGSRAWPRLPPPSNRLRLRAGEDTRGWRGSCLW